MKYTASARRSCHALKAPTALSAADHNERVALRIVRNVTLHLVLLFRIQQPGRIALISPDQEQAAHISELYCGIAAVATNARLVLTDAPQRYGQVTLCQLLQSVSVEEALLIESPRSHQADWERPLETRPDARTPHQYKHAMKKGRVAVPGHGGEDVHPDTLKSVLSQAGLSKR